MNEYKFIATTTFGLEAVCKRELEALQIKVDSVENGKVSFSGTLKDMIKANVWLRTADRVLLEFKRFKAMTFDQLFDQVQDIPWEKYIPMDANFIVDGKSVKSKLFSISDCQRITEKAIIKRLQKTYNIPHFPKTGPKYKLQISLLKDVATLTLDTSGDALHKRGYRIQSVEAPMKETLAAGLILLSYWNKDRILYDMFCGSGTIPIEAAMIGRNIAPGLSRDFAFKNFSFVPEVFVKDVTKEAYQLMDYDKELHIFASDINSKNIEKAMENAEEAGVDDAITFTTSDFKDLYLENKYGVLISNPPYGERLEDQESIQKMTKVLGKKIRPLDTWSTYFFTSYADFEEVYGKKSDRKRKLYNGRIEAWFYQYYGPRPK